eukprot:c4578_g1_i1 orf=3-275(-)
MNKHPHSLRISIRSEDKLPSLPNSCWVRRLLPYLQRFEKPLPRYSSTKHTRICMRLYILEPWEFTILIICSERGNTTVGTIALKNQQVEP